MKRVLTSVLFLILLVGMLYFGIKYYKSDYLPKKRIKDADTKQTELISRIRPEIIDKPESDEKKDWLEPAKEINDDTVGWIVIPNTNIDYPIMQCDDNEFYLHNGADGEYNYDFGCPFLDYRCSKDFKGLNSIVYGHNMIDSLMFADVLRFNEKEYLDSHSSGYIVLEDGLHEIDFFAYISVPSTSFLYHTVFITENDRNEYIDFIFKTARNIINYSAEDIKQTENPKILLLSTCSFEYDDSRGVLAGLIKEID